VLKNSKGLYKIERQNSEANAAEEAITLEQLHRRLGHISPTIS
jgi:hypothetical protein